MSAYGTDGSRILGHLDVSTSQADWSSLLVCPSRYSNEVQDKQLIFSGSPNLSFTVQIDSSPREIKLNEPQSVTVTPENVRIFQFFPPEDIAKTQLDVTVISESADVPAYLKVSRVCKDVEKDNIDEVDYKGESIRLSFGEKGRITLSKVSIPPLTDSYSSWFIGIAIKNATGDTPFNAIKSVTLELNKSFDFSYALPISLLIILSIITGGVISCCACPSSCCFHNETTTLENGIPLNSQGEQNGQSESNEKTHLITGQTLTSSGCCTAFFNWFKEEDKEGTRYSYTAAIVGFMLMIGAVQFVFANWRLMIDEGDRDNCYYNDFCYRVSPWDDIPLNLMISNLVYIIHGLILAVFVWCKEAKHLPNSAEQAFSIGYAFAWAMIFEGLFSLVYHLCPSKLTFQFDTAFMFVIAGLIVISLYNGTNTTNPVGAANFFLYFLVPLFIFNYFGAVHCEAGLPMLLQILFFIALAVWFFIICTWALLKLFFEPDSSDGDSNCKKVYEVWTAFCSFISKWAKCDLTWGFACKTFWSVICVSIPVIFFFAFDLPNVFLFSCIAESVLAILIKYFFSKCKRPVCGCPNCECPECKCPECRCPECRCPECRRPQCNLSSWCGWVCKVFYLSAMGAIWIAALYYFSEKATTDKAETPEKSRNLNQDCIWPGFFDSHDWWHILSSHALLLTVYLVLFMSHK